MENQQEADILELTAEIVSAYVSNNPVPSADLPSLITDINRSLKDLTVDTIEQSSEKLTPAVSIKKSVTRDYIICLEDGKKFKSLKRHIQTKYGLSPQEYREKWGLSFDYPMVAPSYSEARSRLAKELGLGRPAAKPQKKPARRRSAQAVS